ncbi:delta14-sterol reductase [Phakopsora pachyrhizi]|uniref:Delta(14)-sterol reductase ERG24 n=1 Tax=Phakopsora pachyrhizi TaxID=170000 RepID=A0AAV0BSY2_PHAPC|nr:delta14-sterol reductase [Phakopsora pachyrhizi]CAH7688666.1 delta14-sterol reductase [Phakopsora pachyrhizi]
MGLTTPNQVDELNPRTNEFEFGGILGALGITITVPIFTYLLNLSCQPIVGGKLNSFETISKIQEVWNETRLFSHEGFNLYFCWYIYMVLCWAILPGRFVQGTVLRNGDRLTYKINAFATLILTIFLIGTIFWRFGQWPFLYVIDHYFGIITASLIMSILQATYCYWSSFRTGKLLALGGNSGNFLYDWFIGRELNPRVLNESFDIKTFNEMRPGLILWVVLNFCWSIKQIQNFGKLSNSMVLCFLFHFWYVFDAEYNEDTILTQMDITTDGFGFMLSVGDLTWVPFTYSLQLVYLAFVDVKLSNMQILIIIGVQMIGYHIFRTSNEEKNNFRHKFQNPKALKFIETERGTKLLTSGWWGRSRHPNYFGDWIMSWAWCLPTGFGTPVTYFYVIYFGILLIHRQIRDEDSCEKKYGKEDWNRYKKIVPWKIIPYIY